MHRRGLVLWVVILVLVSFMMLWWNVLLAAEPTRGGTLRVVHGTRITHLDFHTAPGYEMMWVAMNVGCGLLDITPNGHFVGDAAESWEVSADGLTYTFTLRDDVFFHDNTKLDAEAVKFSIDRLMDPKTRSGMRRFYEAVDHVEVGNPLMVRVHMRRPYAFFLHMLAAYRSGLVIYSPTATHKYRLRDRKQGRPEAVVGCGPFKLVEWVPEIQLVMERWEKYFKPGLPYLDRIQIRVIKEPLSQVAAFQAGEIDLIASLTPEHMHTIKDRNPNAIIMTKKETTPMVAMMKVTVPCDGKPMSKKRCPHPIFGDLQVRKAIGCYGIDREEIVKIAFRGLATPWVGMTPPGTIDAVDVNHLCPYDPIRAKALLAKAGYDSNNPLTFRLLTDTEKAVFHAIATVIKEQVSRLGVTADIKLVDKGTWANTLTKDGPWDMYVEDLLAQLTPDSNAYLSVTTSSWNAPRHTDTRVDAYYMTYAREMDPVKRQAIAEALQEYMANNLYWNTISGSPFYQVAQSWVKGYVFNAQFAVRYETVWLDK
jgi:peptide/nickel transport system substrate-binding protein